MKVCHRFCLVFESEGRHIIRMAILKRISIGEYLVESQKEIRYLGVLIDNRLSFESHVDRTCETANIPQVVLSRILLNDGGPRSTVQQKLLLGKLLRLAEVTRKMGTGSYSRSTH